MAEFNGDSSYVKSNGTGNLIVPDTLPPTVKSSVISGLYNTNKVVSLTTTDPTVLLLPSTPLTVQIHKPVLLDMFTSLL